MSRIPARVRDTIRRDESRQGSLPALLRALAREAEIDPDFALSRLRLDCVSGHPGHVHCRWVVRWEGTRDPERWPAGVVGPCPACGGEGTWRNENAPFPVVCEEDCCCVACGGTGYLAEGADG